MLRLLLLFLLLLIWAGACLGVEPLSQDFRYISQSELPSSSKLLNLSKTFNNWSNKHHFSKLFTHLEPAFNQVGFSQMAINFYTGEMISITLGVSPSKKIINNRVLSFPKGFIYHSKTMDNLSFILVYLGPKSEKGDRKLSSLGQALRKQRLIASSSFLDLLIPKAYADPGECQGVSRPLQSRELDPLYNKTSEVDFNTHLMKCLGDINLESIGEQFKDQAQSMGDFAVGLLKRAKRNISMFFSDPILLAAYIAGSNINTYNAIKAIPGEIEKSISTFKDLPPELQAELACSFAQSLGVSGVMTLASAGFGSAKIQLLFAQWLNRAKNLTPLLESLQKLPGSLPDMRNIVRNLNRYSQEKLDLIKMFTDMKDVKVARGVASCAL